MARHDQRPKPNKFVCTLCRDFDCAHCIDVARSVYSSEPICVCPDSDHEIKLNLGILELREAVLK